MSVFLSRSRLSCDGEDTTGFATVRICLRGGQDLSSRLGCNNGQRVTAYGQRGYGCDRRQTNEDSRLEGSSDLVGGGVLDSRLEEESRAAWEDRGVACGLGRQRSCVRLGTAEIVATRQRLVLQIGEDDATI